MPHGLRAIPHKRATRTMHAKQTHCSETRGTKTQDTTQSNAQHEAGTRPGRRGRKEERSEERSAVGWEALPRLGLGMPQPYFS